MTSDRCRHHAAWLIAMPFTPYLWCPDCGALREMVQSEKNGVWPRWSGWVYPRGREAALKRLGQVDK